MAQPDMSSGRITIIRGTGGIPVAVSALRERRAPSSPDDQRDTSRDDNPFAAPPKGTPDQPWQPRRPAAGGKGDDGDEPERPQDGQPGNGDRWSSDQPEPHKDGSAGPGPFGTQSGGGTPPGAGRRPGPAPGQGPGSQGGPGGPGRPPGAGPRFDVTDPVQRRARYALLTGMWGLFFGLYGLSQVSLLLGALALYWGITSLRGKAKQPAAQTQPSRDEALSAWQSPKPERKPAPQQSARTSGAGTQKASPYESGQQKPQFTAALCGTIAGAIALLIVATTFSFQLAYKDYFSCVNNALTQPARQSCNTLLPQPLRHYFSLQG
jgi:hypothetical protein